jgi:hypothetical protein
MQPRQQLYWIRFKATAKTSNEIFLFTHAITKQPKTILDNTVQLEFQLQLTSTPQEIEVSYHSLCLEFPDTTFHLINENQIKRIKALQNMKNVFRELKDNPYRRIR